MKTGEFEFEKEEETFGSETRNEEMCCVYGI
jgi:hypothetical protein